MSDKPALERLTADLGSVFEFSKTAIKLFATCRFTHGPAEALLRVSREHQFTADDIQSIEISAFQESAELDNRPEPASRHDSIFSHQYAAALALLRRRIELRDLDEPTRTNAEVRAIARRISVVHDPKLDNVTPGASQHRLTLTLKQGLRLTVEDVRPPGGANSPLPMNRVIEKFNSLTEPILGSDAAGYVSSLVSTLDAAPNLSQLMALLSARKASNIPHSEDQNASDVARPSLE